jgi:hypothetical protein
LIERKRIRLTLLILKQQLSVNPFLKYHSRGESSLTLPLASRFLSSNEDQSFDDLQKSSHIRVMNLEIMVAVFEERNWIVEELVKQQQQQQACKVHVDLTN